MADDGGFHIHIISERQMGWHAGCALVEVTDESGHRFSAIFFVADNASELLSSPERPTRCGYYCPSMDIMLVPDLEPGTLCQAILELIEDDLFGAVFRDAEEGPQNLKRAPARDSRVRQLGGEELAPEDAHEEAGEDADEPHAAAG